MTIKVQMAAFCGMVYDVATGEEPEEARRRVARFLRRKRNAGYGVSTLERGQRWEVTEPEDAFMIPDDAGILSIQVESSRWEEGYDEEDDA